MIRFILLIIILVFIGFQAVAQQLNTPKEFADIMKYSQIRYFVDSNARIVEEVFLVESPFYEMLRSVSDSKAFSKAIRKGDKFYKKGKWKKALKYYEKALKMETDNVWILRRIGMVYNFRKEPKKAIVVFNNLLETNELDYESWLGLAESHVALSDTSEAIKAIAKAHIYNRNNPFIEKKMTEIFNSFAYQTDNYIQFNPKCEIQKVGKDSVTIAYESSIWGGYANCKAVWKYDENYQKAKANGFPKNLDLVQEKECLLNFLILYELSKDADKQVLKAEYNLLTKAIDTHQLNAFIQYEIWLVENPTMIQRISEDDLEGIIAYLLTVKF